MKVLVVKTSSLGDLIHTLPALSDAAATFPDIRFHWVAEEAFTEIPTWHPAVERIIPVALRRWRKGWLNAISSGEIGRFLHDLRRERYDFVIDAQGLFFKSAIPALLAHGERVGYDGASIRDRWASYTYQYKYSVFRQQHAVDRVRKLFALSLNYLLPDTPPDFQIKLAQKEEPDPSPYLVFLHGTSWPSKHWTEAHWAELIRYANEEGYEVCLPWGNAEEREQASRLAEGEGSAKVLPRLSLGEVAQKLRNAAGIVGLDSGLSHLAAALEVPGVSLYGPTSPVLTGVKGRYHRNLVAGFSCVPCLRKVCGFKGQKKGAAACLTTLTPEKVWAVLCEQLRKAASGRQRIEAGLVDRRGGWSG